MSEKKATDFIQRTLCLVKPDGVRRGLTGEIISRFERCGLKIVAMKMVQADKELAGKHYTWEDIGAKHGDEVRNRLLKFLTAGPVVAFVLEGVEAIKIVRKICGATDPQNSAPGTIRGDFSHHNVPFAVASAGAIHNVVHASADQADAVRETALWFSPEEYCPYKRADEKEHYL